jgi:hypothetical protein
VCSSLARQLDSGNRPVARLPSLHFGQFYTHFARTGCDPEAWTPGTGRQCLQIGNLMMTEANGFTAAFLDYDEPRDHLYALEAPVRTVALESEPGLCELPARVKVAP